MFPPLRKHKYQKQAESKCTWTEFVCQKVKRNAVGHKLSVSRALEKSRMYLATWRGNGVKIQRLTPNYVSRLVSFFPCERLEQTKLRKRGEKREKKADKRMKRGKSKRVIWNWQLQLATQWIMANQISGKEIRWQREKKFVINRSHAKFNDLYE